MDEDFEEMEIGEIRFYRNENGVINRAIKRIPSSLEKPNKPEFNMAARIIVDDKSEEEIKTALTGMLNDR